MDLKRSRQQPLNVAHGLSKEISIDAHPTSSSRYRSLVEGEVIQTTDVAGDDPQVWTLVPSHWVSQVYCLAVYGQVRRPTIRKGCC